MLFSSAYEVSVIGGIAFSGNALYIKDNKGD